MLHNNILVERIELEVPINSTEYVSVRNILLISLSLPLNSKWSALTEVVWEMWL